MTLRQSYRPSSIQYSNRRCPMLRVLVIDDDHDMADSLAMLLDSWGHQTAIAYDGPTGLQLHESFRADVALIDVSMPGMSGATVAEKMRSDLSCQPTLV